jgi:signal transduction histidine kinase
MQYAELELAVANGLATDSMLATIRERSKRINLDFLREEIPAAIVQSIDGTVRVAQIVRAMKDFSHPGGEDKMPIDLNAAVSSTVTVCRNEWKYVATVETEFDENLPPLICLPGEINQTILNVVVNAAHAIKDKLGDQSTELGLITINTSLRDGWIELRISDTGTGIPDPIRDKIFDPFFTTKGVGRGTGQGLAMAYSTIVEKHAGEIKVESETGKGTTFILRLPAHPEQLTPVRGAKE